MPDRSNRLLTPGRVALAGSAAATAIGVRRIVRSVRRGWDERAVAPEPVAQPSEPAQAPPASTSSAAAPPRGWRQVVGAAWRSGKQHHVPLLSAGIAYYAFLAIPPALIAVVLVYGLVSSPADVERQIASFADALPADVESLLTAQLTSIAAGSTGALSVGLAISVGLALFSASGGMQGLMTALNVVYRQEETRNVVRLRATALALTLGAVIFFVVSVALVGVLPAVVGMLPLGPAGETVVLVLRWVGLLVAFPVALAVLFRYGPDRGGARTVLLGAGAAVATVIWLLVSLGFSFYVDNFGSYGETYGTLAGVVVLILWLYFSAYAVLLGAEVNAASELGAGGQAAPR